MIRFSLICAGTLSFAAIASTALAGTEVPGRRVDAAIPPAILPDASMATVRDTRRLPGQTLRCWQNGRLVYEAGGFRNGAERSPAAVTIPRSTETDPVVVLDLKQGMCILSGQ